MAFEGFTPEASEFLWDLRFNNERPWFNAHKEQFLALVDVPFKALARETLERMADAYPKREWYLHVSRIYRDARRLYGRGPYKDHLWFTLRCAESKDPEIPALYFEFAPDGYSYGFGYWGAPPALMERFRRNALANPAKLERLARAVVRQDVFQLGGKDYARKKAEHSDLLDPWLNKRSVMLDCSHSHDALEHSHALADEICEGFRFLVPYYDYFDALRHLAD